MPLLAAVQAGSFGFSLCEVALQLYILVEFYNEEETD